MMTKQFAISQVGICTITELEGLKRIRPKIHIIQLEAVNLLLKLKKKRRADYLTAFNNLTTKEVLKCIESDNIGMSLNKVIRNHLKNNR